MLSPGLEKFFTAIEPGSDPFFCERYAADLERIFTGWSNALTAQPRQDATLGDALAADILFTPLDRFDVKPVSIRPPIHVDMIHFHSDYAHGSSDFNNSLATYLRSFVRVRTAEFLITDLRIARPSPVIAEIDVRYDIAGDLDHETKEERVGLWRLTCAADKRGEWQIQKWSATEETRARLAGPGFVDVTEQALRGNTAAQRQFAHGTDFWRSAIDAAAGIDVYGNNGVAAGDYDGDGLDDLYICQPSGLPNRLLRNRGDGTFEDVTEGSGLGLLDGTACALFADFTNSGTQHLIVVRTNGPLLYLNRGQGKFELKPDAFRFAKPPSGTFTGIAAADYNRDGLLDVYFCLYAYYQGLSQYTHPQPYYDAQNGPPNFLMRNRGDGTFEDVTQASGMNENNNRFTFACGWCDYDNDGWPDLYVANDFGRKNLYHNNRDGTFRDLGKAKRVEDYGAGMSVAWFDYDNDGRQDLYVTDMYSAAGRRVTGQEEFLRGVDPDIREIYRKHASGNSLFKNTPGLDAFAETSAKAAVSLGRWSWSGDAWDFDHDGRTDMYVTNGFISGENRSDLASFFWRQIVARSMGSGAVAADYQLAWNAINELIRADYSWNGYERNILFLNTGTGTFAEISAPLGLDFKDDSRAFALADFDGDGRLELVLKNRTGPQLRFLRNDLNHIGDSVTFRLRGAHSNRDAIGASVIVDSAIGKQTKFVRAGSGFLSQHTKDLSFGLGASSGPLRATIQWPNGGTQHLENLPPQHLIEVTENDSHWSAKLFKTRSTNDTAQTPKPTETLPSQFRSWLIEPLPAPALSLLCLDGRTRTLQSFAGNPLLLAIVRGTCEASLLQLASLAHATASFTAQQIQVAALHLGADAQPLREFAGRNPLPFPVLLADETAAGIYSILYRYLFDRRRDIQTPTLLLLDDTLAIFKVDRGGATGEALLHDFAKVPRTPESRVALALPFAGHFHGDLPRRNFFTYGIAYVQSDYTDAALACFEASVARNPNYAAAYYNMGTVYLNKHLLPEAKQSLEKAVALDPHDADALTNLGSVLGQKKDYDGAYRYFEEALRVRPNHVIALQNIVMLDRMNGHLDKAQQALRAAIAADPADPEFHFALGMLLAGANEFEQAGTELERATKLGPNDPITLNNLGVVYLRLNRIDDALLCFVRCIRMTADYDRPVLNLASIYKQKGQIEKATQVLQEFLSRHPENEELAAALRSLK